MRVIYGYGRRNFEWVCWCFRNNKIPLTPKENKNKFIIAKSKTLEYEQKKEV